MWTTKKDNKKISGLEICETEFYRAVCLMPPLKLQGSGRRETFIGDSPVVKWLLRWPEVKAYVFDTVKYYRAIKPNYENAVWYGAGRYWDSRLLDGRTDSLAADTIELCKKACTMTLLRHFTPGEDFNIHKSCVINWLIAQPETMFYVLISAMKIKAIISRDDCVTWVGAMMAGVVDRIAKAGAV